MDLDEVKKLEKREIIKKEIQDLRKKLGIRKRKKGNILC